MKTMTLLPRSRPLTHADLEALPDDGHRYELVDGALVVTPAPLLLHQRAVLRLGRLLGDAVTEGFEVLPAPFDVRLGDDTVVQPDVLVARLANFDAGRLIGVPVLVVEVLSPSTRLIDLTLKKARYEQAGCPAYWIVDPEEPSVTVWELRAGRYAEVARASDNDALTVERPFQVTLRPRGLVSG